MHPAGGQPRWARGSTVEATPRPPVTQPSWVLGKNGEPDRAAGPGGCSTRGSPAGRRPGGPEARPAGLSRLAPGGHPWLLSLASKALQVFSRDEPDKDMYAAPVTSWAQWPGDMELVTAPKAVQGPQLMLRQILSQILQTPASKCPRVGTTISCYTGRNGSMVRRSSRARSGW